MNISFYTASTGMITQQDAMNIYSNNISNVNTVGYKPLRPSFADCIYTDQRATEEDWDTGHGQFINKTDFMWDIGGLVETGQELDYALPNNDFFQVLDANGNNFLTRDGSFQISFIEDHWELVNGNGDFVLDYDGNHITVPFETVENEDGELIVTDTIDFAALNAQIGVFSVANNWGLEQADGNHFVITERSGQPTANLESDKMQYWLEQSSVDLATEMVHIIETQRSYQLNSRIIQTSDEMQQIANNIR